MSMHRDHNPHRPIVVPTEDTEDTRTYAELKRDTERLDRIHAEHRATLASLFRGESDPWAAE